MMSDARSTTAQRVTIDDAYVSATSGIAAGDSATTAPDQIYVEFSSPVLIQGANGAAVPADGFRVDGTAAGIETVRLGATVTDGDDAPGSRVLVLSLSMGVAADEEPRLSYDPSSGRVTTASGEEPEPVDSLEVTPGSPRVLDVAIPAGEGDLLQVTFDRPVESRTGDASMLSVTGGDGDRLLDGDIYVDGNRVTLPLTHDVTDSGVDSDGQLTLRYRAGGSDTERLRNLVGEESALVQPFAEPIAIEVAAGGFSIAEASVPLAPNSSGNVDHSRVALWFEPPMTAKTAAGYELRDSRAKVRGLASTGSGAEAPDVMLDLDAPVDAQGDSQPTVRYSPERGDTRAAGNEVPEAPLSAPVQQAGSAPTALGAQLTASRDAIAVEFSRSVVSQTNDASGVTLTGTSDVSLTGAVTEGKTTTFELSDPLDLRETSNTVKLNYSTQADSGRRLNLLAADDGVPVESFSVEVDRSGATPAVKHASVPPGSRDRLWVRFDRPVRADSAAGFSLEGTAARVEQLANPDDLNDNLVPYTLVFELHVEAQGDSASLVYDAEAGNVDGEDGSRVESFEQPVDVLPPAPTVRGATVDRDASAIRVRYDREIVLNQHDATGFGLSYGVDMDGLPRLTGRARVDGTDVLVETEEPVTVTAEPVLSYQPDDAANVLGAADGVAAESATVHVEQDPDAGEGAPEAPEEERDREGGDEESERDSDDDGDSDADDGDSDADSDDGTRAPELLSAEVPNDSGDRIVCHFDAPVDPDSGTFEIGGTDAEIVGIVDDEETTHELTLELDPTLEAGDEPVIRYTADC